jgi:uncharacterized LabA/DUF88 family protein
MFNPKTQRLKELSLECFNRIQELEGIFDRKTNVYIDYANVKPWANKLGWHIELKRLKQFLDSFDAINSVKFYNGTLAGDSESEQFMRDVERFGFDIHTKPVKVMKLSIDVSSIPLNSPDILKNFIRKPLLQQLKIEAVEFLNNQLKQLNEQSILSVEDLKCNFDVEIGRDMLIDYDKNGIDNFVLWSGDSDFADPVKQLLNDGKKVVLFATARRVSSELSELVNGGLFIFDIQKIKNFICWKKEIKIN